MGRKLNRSNGKTVYPSVAEATSKTSLSPKHLGLPEIRIRRASIYSQQNAEQAYRWKKMGAIFEKAGRWSIYLAAFGVFVGMGFGAASLLMFTSTFTSSLGAVSSFLVIGGVVLAGVGACLELMGDHYQDRSVELQSVSDQYAIQCKSALKFMEQIYHPKRDMTLVLETNQPLKLESDGSYSEHAFATATYSAMLDKQIKGLCMLDNEGLVPLDEIAQLFEKEEARLLQLKEKFLTALIFLKRRDVLMDEEVKNMTDNVEDIGIFSYAARLKVIHKKREDIFKKGFVDIQIVSHAVEKNSNNS